MKAVLPVVAAFAFVFAAVGCESMHHDDKEACKCKASCTCPHCGKTADKCDCGSKK